jgi:hypothetical protein
MNVFSNNENIVRNITGLIKKKSMKNLNKNTTKIKQNNNFIVYIHIRPDINKPFYVGKGIPKRDRSKYGRNQYWHNIVNKNNGIFESKILFEGLSEEEALLKEREIELDLKNKGYILTNIIECGIKAGTTGMKHSEESKRKISEGLKGHISSNKGKKQSKETCDKKSKSMLGKKVRLGTKDSEETRKKKSEAFKGRTYSEESKQKKNEKLKDKTIYNFYNTLTEETFIGTRHEFKEKFNHNLDQLSLLIRQRINKYKNWIKYEKN